MKTQNSVSTLSNIMDADENYPRPQLRRDNWTSLDGLWQFAIDHEARRTIKDVVFDRTIVVPFSPETPASSIADTGFYKSVWYKRSFEAPKLRRGEKLTIHFGAVDWSCDIYVNGVLAAHHDGGYTPFEVEVSSLLKARGPQTITVRAHDDPQDMSKPRGKQDWRRDAHSIWYPRTTGIWQSVWMEVRPAVAVTSLAWTADVPSWSIAFAAEIAGHSDKSLSLRVVLHRDGRVLTDNRYGITGDTNVGNGHGFCLKQRIDLPDPGIEDERFDLLWSPEHPHLISAEISLIENTIGGKAGKVVDKIVDCVRSYTAMRSVAVDASRFVLNGRPYHLALVLDQGYWRESGLTAPDTRALHRDVELVKELGFNGVRKHQKIEDPRFLFLADKLGLMVWEEMPSPYAFTSLAQERLIATWTAAIKRDVSHPCIVAWVPYNESWGLPDLPVSQAQRDSQRALYYLTRTLDPTRPVIGNDGWEMCAGDIIAIHDYDGDSPRLAARYSSSSNSSARDLLFKNERPGGRELILDGYDHSGKPVMLTEFGGICYAREEGSWGYKRVNSPEELAEQYRACIAAVRTPHVFAGFCYTQFTDTYQEANGLLYMDRTAKYEIKQIHAHTQGRG